MHKYHNFVKYECKQRNRYQPDIPGSSFNTISALHVQAILYSTTTKFAPRWQKSFEDDFLAGWLMTGLSLKERSMSWFQTKWDAQHQMRALP
ncbi:hypothetical protein N7463_004721 [Penicillium fimorum]|uniref:Uncharacterized protein n=1 Tax=Penicillium fimorum TaxID=1882269 RepID=A0A9W9Y3C9_9EURO|nr:hypothetical protein N7463_004721 [Penicillium fimorum]